MIILIANALLRAKGQWSYAIASCPPIVDQKFKREKEQLPIRSASPWLHLVDWTFKLFAFPRRPIKPGGAERRGLAGRSSFHDALTLDDELVLVLEPESTLPSHMSTSSGCFSHSSPECQLSAVVLALSQLVRPP